MSKSVLSVEAVMSYWNELEKIAVDVGHLASRLNSLKGVQHFTEPAKAIFAPGVHPLATRSGGAAALLTKGQEKVQRRVIKQMYPGAMGDMHVSALKNNIAGQHGNIGIFSPQQISDTFQQAFGRGASTPEGQKALHTATLAHEVHERSIAPRNVHPVYGMQTGHVSPDVLLREHNMLSRLTGPGADEAVATVRNLRKVRGDGPQLHQMVGDLLGPRATQFLEPGQKVPKAMRKALLRKLRGEGK